MDGVIDRGGQLIPGADRFIHELREAEIPFRFLTNNSQRTQRDVATRLQRLGTEVEEEHIYTCATATARFLAQQKPRGTAFVTGEGGLLTALHGAGYAIVDKDPDYVVVGEGRTLSFEMVGRARPLHRTPGGDLFIGWAPPGILSGGRRMLSGIYPTKKRAALTLAPSV